MPLRIEGLLRAARRARRAALLGSAFAREEGVICSAEGWVSCFRSWICWWGVNGEGPCCWWGFVKEGKSQDTGEMVCEGCSCPSRVLLVLDGVEKG